MKYLGKVEIPNTWIVPIIHQGAIAGPVADGRFIPVLVLDETRRPELNELIRVHRHLNPGDVASTWTGLRGNADILVLLLEFSAPIELQLAVQFSIEEQGILIDSIVRTNAVYVQTGRPGEDHLRTDAPRILLEIPDTGFVAVWEPLLLKRMISVIRRDSGLSKRKARDAAASFLAQKRSILDLRVQEGTSRMTKGDLGWTKGDLG